MSAKEKYFWIIIILIGGAGVWLPVGVTLLSNKPFKWADIPPNMVTYFMSVVVSGCTDRGMRILENSEDEDGNIKLSVIRWQSEFLDVIGFISVGLLLVLFATLSIVFDYTFLAYVFAGVGLGLSLRIWWNVNVKEEKMNASDALGPTPQINS